MNSPEKVASLEWKCPNCGADANDHGKGECADSLRREGCCNGFLCECLLDDDDGDDELHGVAHDHPCHQAHCYHCGWEGTFPRVPKGLTSWEKQALLQGWAMPEKRKTELKDREAELARLKEEECKSKKKKK